MQDAWRAYLELALGLTEASKKRAQTVARKLVGQGGATAAQLQGLAEELRSTSVANRAALVKIVRFEVERALGAVGLATAEEVAELTARVQQLERDVRESRRTAPSGVADTAPAAGRAAAVDRPVGKAVAPRKVAKKALAKKVVAKKDAAAKKAAAKRQPPAAGTA